MIGRHRDDSRTLTIARAAADDGRARAGGSVPRTGRKSAPGPAPEPARAPEPPKIEGPKMNERIATARPTGSASGSAKGSRWFRPSVVNVKLIYAGYLASLALPFLAIVAALFAYQSAKQNPPAWLATHYTYQMRTFWIGLVANIIAYVLSFIGVGLLLFPLIAIWLVARAVKGLIRVARQDEIEEPNSYFV